jgi:hypothetical protein
MSRFIDLYQQMRLSSSRHQDHRFVEPPHLALQRRGAIQFDTLWQLRWQVGDKELVMVFDRENINEIFDHRSMPDLFPLWQTLVQTTAPGP